MKCRGKRKNEYRIHDWYNIFISLTEFYEKKRQNVRINWNINFYTEYTIFNDSDVPKDKAHVWKDMITVIVKRKIKNEIR